MRKASFLRYKSSSKNMKKIVQSYELTGNKFNELQEQKLRRNEEMQPKKNLKMMMKKIFRC